MATIDSLQDSVNTLTSSTTALLDEVNVSKATLIDSKDLAEAAATSATTQAANAASSASAASSSASSASSSASAASASAASASAIVTGVATGMPSVRPSLNLDFVNSKTVDPRISFTRSTTATYYDGKTTAKAEENLVQYSNDFSSWWAVSRSTRTLNAIVAPDGTTTGVKHTQVGTTTYGPIYTGSAITTSGEPTISVYAKYGTSTYYCILTNEMSIGAVFDMSTGTLSQVSGGSATITAVGDGWYRLTYTKNAGVNNNSMMYLGNRNSGTITNNDANDGEYTYVWGAQFEIRDSVTAYTPTTTSPITNYIPVLQTAAVNEPRLDHDPVTGEAKGLLIEEARTNLKEVSISTGALAKCTRESYSVIAPDGSQNAHKITSNIETGDHQVNLHPVGQSITNGTTYTISAYGKRDSSGGTLTLRSYTGAAWISARIRPEDDYKVEDGCTAGYEAVGNGWYRYWMTFTAAADYPTFLFIIGIGDPNGYWSYNGSTLKYSISYWGLQAEVGSFPTSYIPTSGASVTRGNEFPYIYGVTIKNKTSVYAEYSYLALQSAYGNTVWSTEGNANGHYIRNYTYGTNPGALLSDYSGSRQFTFSGMTPIVAGQVYKSFAAFGDGTVRYKISSQPDLYTDGTFLYPTHTYMSIGYQMNGHMRKFSLYPAAIADSELATAVQD